MCKNSNDQSGVQVAPSEESVSKHQEMEARGMITIEFENPTEAFAAVAIIVIAADNLGTISERDFLFGRVKNLDVFKSYDQTEFTKLLSDAVEKAYETLPMDGSSITKQGIASLTQGVREVLNPELRVQVFEMALGLASADGLCDEEKTLIEQLQHGLEIDDRVAQSILGGSDLRKQRLTDSR